MTDNELKIVLKQYAKWSITYGAQKEYYLQNGSKTACRITLDLFYRSRKYPIDIINSSINKLDRQRNDIEIYRHIFRQLTQLKDFLKAERLATRVERRRCVLCAEYDKLVINSIQETQSMIDILARHI